MTAKITVEQEYEFARNRARCVAKILLGLRAHGSSLRACVARGLLEETEWGHEVTDEGVRQVAMILVQETNDKTKRARRS